MTTHNLRTCPYAHCPECAFLSKTALRELGMSSFKAILSAYPNLQSFDALFADFSSNCYKIIRRLYNTDDYKEIFYGVLSSYDSYIGEISYLKDTDMAAYTEYKEFSNKLVKMMHKTWSEDCPNGVGYVTLPLYINHE